MSFHFQYPQVLWLLVAVPVFIACYWLYLNWKKKRIMQMGKLQLVNNLFKNHSPQKTMVKFCTILLAFVLGCIALANPRKREKALTEVRKGIDIMIALDVSNSMLANDISPNRLQNAQQLIAQLMNGLPNDRIGLVLFAGNAYVQAPLTYDHDAVAMVTATANPAAIRTQGTAIGDALEKCALSFDEQSERFNAVVLISDGETHDENAIKKARQLADQGIMINAVGIGSAHGATIIDTTTNSPKRDASGAVIISKLDERTLQEMAAVTGGTYIHLINVSQAANTLIQQLSQMDKKPMGEFSQANYQSFYLWLTLPMLLLLIIEIFISERKKVSA